MSRARRRSSSPVSLFPFLAVLVSTMGALVLLLLAINRRATLQAIAKATEAILGQTAADDQWLSNRRRELENELTALQDNLTSAEHDQRRVEGQLRSADQRARSRAADIATSQRELDRLGQQREQIEREFDAVRRRTESLRVAQSRLLEERGDANRTFVPVVHPGSNGTVRQPIYIECAAESVTIQPEGIELPLRVLASGAAGRNALSRAIGALCDFWPKRWQAEGHAADDEQCTPYPLLLVRPEGVMSYHAARAALEPLGLPFGYELVERDWMLRYPEPDLDARAVALAAIRERSPTRHAFATGRGTNGQAASDGVQNRSTELTHGADELLASVASQTADSPLESGDDPTAGPEPVDSAADRSHDHASPAGAVGGTPRDPTRGTVGVNPAARQPVLDSGVPRRAAPVTSSRSPARAATPRSAQSGVSSGEDFAAEPRLPANPEGGGKIAVPRSIRVDCAADRVVVGERAATIALTGAASPDAALGQLFEEIDREVHDWGPAGTTFRWVPKLQFRVQPDALETFYGLRFALAGSSLQIEHEVVLD